MKPSSRSYRVAVIYNSSDEHAEGDDVDLISEKAVEDEAQAVMQALEKKGHQSFLLGLGLIERDLVQITSAKPDMIFNLCEGYRGKARHEMFIAGLWELLGIPYSGNNPLTLGLAQNKVLTKRLLDSKRIPTPPYQVYRKVPESTFLTYPIIAKPACEDASLGITQEAVIENFDQLKVRVGHLLEKYQQPVLVEQFIDGREFNVSVLGHSPARVLAVSEIDFSSIDTSFHKITSYEAKWLKDHTLYKNTPAVCPAVIKSSLKHKLQEAALMTYQLLGGRDYGRVDFRVDEDENIYVLEFNPNPDISLDAGYSNALRAAGLKYADFVEYIINQTMSRLNHDKN